MPPKGYDYLIFGDEEPFVVHHEDCEDHDLEDHSGDATWRGVEGMPDADEEYDVSCSCLDDLFPR